MPLQIPVGYHIWSATFNVTGSSHNVTTTCGGTNGILVTATAINNSWRAEMTSGVSRPFNAGNIPTGYQMVETKCLANIGGTLFSDTNFTSLTGSGTTTAAPMNCAVLVQKDTGIAGRKFRGRWFAPMLVSESNIDPAGIIAPATVATLQGWFTGAYNGLITAGQNPVLLHVDNSTPTPITAFRVSQKVGTIGRRIRR